MNTKAVEFSLTLSCITQALQQLRDSQFHNPVDVFDRCMQADLVNCLEDDLPDTRVRGDIM